jgi:putative transposase
VNRIAKQYNWEIIEQEVDQDHIHILVRHSPKWSILQIVRLLKQITTYYAWKNFKEYLAVEFYKEHTFWNDGYFVCSIGNVSHDTIKKYISTQGS